jgi:hypothetical protein
MLRWAFFYAPVQNPAGGERRPFGLVPLKER